MTPQSGPLPTTNPQQMQQQIGSPQGRLRLEASKMQQVQQQMSQQIPPCPADGQQQVQQQVQQQMRHLQGTV